MGWMLELAPAWAWWLAYGGGCLITIALLGAASARYGIPPEDPFGFLLTVALWPLIATLIAPLVVVGAIYSLGEKLGKPHHDQ